MSLTFGPVVISPGLIVTALWLSLQTVLWGTSRLGPVKRLSRPVFSILRFGDKLREGAPLYFQVALFILLFTLNWLPTVQGLLPWPKNKSSPLLDLSCHEKYNPGERLSVQTDNGWTEYENETRTYSLCSSQSLKGQGLEFDCSFPSSSSPPTPQLRTNQRKPNKLPKPTP